MIRRGPPTWAVPALAAPGAGVRGLATPAAACTGCDARHQNLARMRPGPGPESPQ